MNGRYIFKFATKKAGCKGPDIYNGDVIWDESDGPVHLKFWSGNEYVRLSDMVRNEVDKYMKETNRMNDRPTPETDAEHAQFKMGGFTLDFCRKLERERDEARKTAEKAKAYKRVLKEDNKKLRRERDEAREALSDWENAAAHVEADHADEIHCGCVPVLRKLLIDARKERDGARKVLREIAEASGFDNIGNWARNKARKEIDRYREKNDLLPISWDV